jgi:hypothetical protein
LLGLIAKQPQSLVVIDILLGGNYKENPIYKEILGLINSF